MDLYYGRRPVPVPSNFVVYYEKYKTLNPFNRYPLAELAKDSKLIKLTARNLLIEYQKDLSFSERNRIIKNYKNKKRKELQ